MASSLLCMLYRFTWREMAGTHTYKLPERSEYHQQEGSNSHLINSVWFRLFTSIAAGYFQFIFKSETKI